MTPLSEFPFALALPPLVEATLRSTALVAVAALAALALRRVPAAVRHLVWTLALVGCVAMPLAAPVVPGWSVPGLPAWSAGIASPPNPAPPPPSATVASPAPAVSRPALERPAFAADPTPPSPAATTWRLRGADVLRALPLVWLAGVLVLLARYGLGWLRLTRLARRAAPMMDPDWLSALARHAEALGLRRLPALRVSPAIPVPIACGARRPTIVLPVGAATWSVERRDAVLLHELAHVRRLDLITARLTQLAAMLYWFHPLVWHAARAQRAEAERACDDQVLEAGARASAYASDLLEIARSIGGDRLDAAALAMARRSQLEGRLLAILDPRLSRGGAGPGTIVIAVLVAAGAIGAIAAARPAQSRRAVETTAAVNGTDPATPTQADGAEGAEPGSKALLPATRGSDGLLSTAANLLTGKVLDAKGTSKSGTWNYRDGHGSMLVSKGTVRYNDDFDDIESISPGGWVEIEERRDGKWHKATFTGRAGGIERSYQVQGVERPWGAEGRAWLAQFLIEIDRGSGTFVEQRFPRLMNEGGPTRVLREVSAMTSDYGRGVYLRKLLASDLDPASVRRAVAQAGREIESDYELSNTLIDAAARHGLDDAATRAAYLEAANTLASDYEHGRALMALVERSGLSPELVEGAIASASKMGSDYEQAKVMIAMAERGHVRAERQRAFIRAAHGLDSDYERSRVLRSLLEEGRLEAENVGEMVQATARFSSDFERANVLVELARSVPMTEPQRAAFVESTRDMGSDHERGRALSALAKFSR